MKEDTLRLRQNLLTSRVSLSSQSNSVQNERGQAAAAVNFKRRFTLLYCYCFFSFLLGMGEGTMEAGRQRKRDRRTDSCFSSASFNRSGATSAYECNYQAPVSYLPSLCTELSIGLHFQVRWAVAGVLRMPAVGQATLLNKR